MARDALDMPPLLRHVAPPEGVDAFGHACAIAGAAGAGTLAWRRAADVCAFAVVLEPEGALAEARRAFFATMAALGDALAAHCAPERLVTFLWPDTVLYDAARLGGARLAWPDACAEDAEPDWLVFGVELIRARPGLAEAGRAPDSTALIEEAFDDDAQIVESFARYLMLYADTWGAQGFQPVADAYLGRLADKGPQARLDARGDLVAPGAEPRGLLAGLAAARWRDPLRGGPRL